MRYNWLTAVAAVFFTVLLSSCNGSPGVIVPDFSEYDGLYPGNVEVSAIYGLNSAKLPVFEALADEFSKTNEWGIKVNIRQAEISSADMAIISPPEASRLLREGQSEELSPLLSHPVWKIADGRRGFYAAARKQTDYWDFSLKVTSIPLSMDSCILIVNDDLLKEAGFEKIPGNWKFMHYMMYKIKKLTGRPAMGMEFNSQSVVPFIHARGGSIQSPAGITYSLINPVVNRTLRYIRRLNKKNMLSSNNYRYSNQTEFAFGKLPMVFTGIDGLKAYSELISMTSPELQWSAALLPTRRPDSGVTVNCTHTAAVLKGPVEKRLASWLFIRWLAEPEQQIKISSMTYSLPAEKSALQKIIDEKPEAFVPQWLQAASAISDAHMEYIPDLPDYETVSERFNELVNRYIGNGGWIWLDTIRLEYEIKKGGEK